MVDGIIFDLDGTLWDAAAACAKAWNEALVQTGYGDHAVDAEMVRSVSGLQVEKIMQDHFQFMTAEEQKAMLARYKEREGICVKAYGGELFPQAKEVLAQLSKTHRLFVVSNCLSGYIENFMAFHHLQDFFTDFECSGNTGQPKSENIKLIVQRNGLCNPVYVGDTPWDGEAAQKAGVPFIFAAYGFGNVDNAERKIESLAELPVVLQNLAGAKSVFFDKKPDKNS